MTTMLPRSRPELSRTDALAFARAAGCTDDLFLLGRRGYYRDSMGRPGANDRGIYDDAICLVTPDRYLTFNANTDPSAFRTGIATLTAGVWRYKLGIHGLSKPKEQQYQALIQAAAVTVIRDGQGPDTGWFGLNIHKGGTTTTGSAGCQTIHPTQWPEFIVMVRVALAKYQRTTIPYVLSVRPDVPRAA